MEREMPGISVYLHGFVVNKMFKKKKSWVVYEPNYYGIIIIK